MLLTTPPSLKSHDFFTVPNLTSFCANLIVILQRKRGRGITKETKKDWELNEAMGTIAAIITKTATITAKIYSCLPKDRSEKKKVG